jgi:hypothetical protein
MKSVRGGKNTSVAVEVTNISRNGFWLLLGGDELFVEFKKFPWFKEASIAQLLSVTRPAPHHLYWPELDVDLAVDSLIHPERFPLVSRARTFTVNEPRRGTTGARAKKTRSRRNGA